MSTLIRLGNILPLFRRYGAAASWLVLCCVLLVAGQGEALAQRNLSVAQSGYTPVERRIALVIGNSAYATSPLKNPVNDARAMSAKLKAVGFDVLYKENVKIKQIGKTMMEFRSMLSPGAVALIFYAGHGLQIKGSNYLPAVDADITSELDVPLQSFELSRLLSLLEESKTGMNLVFLDACRNNPFSRSFRSTSAGLARVEAPSGTLISYATRPGSVAADGDGANGLYTSQLIQQIDVKDVPIETVLKRVTAGVKRISKGAQEPWMEGSIEGEFYFRATSPEQREAEQRSSMQLAAEKKAAEQEAAEKRAAEKRAADQRAEQLAAEKRAAQQRADQLEAEKRAAAQRLSEQRLAEQQAAGQKKSTAHLAPLSPSEVANTSSSLFPSKGTRYSYRVKRLNDTWIETFVVLGEGGHDGDKVFLISLEGKDTLLLYDLKTGNWKKTVRKGSTAAMATPYEDILRFPLAEGGNHSSEYYGSDSTASGHIGAIVEVHSKEKIEVPAGVFVVYPIKAQLRYFTSGAGSMSKMNASTKVRTKSIWYSQDLRIAVKIDDRDDTASITTRYELIEYSAQGDSVSKAPVPDKEGKETPVAIIPSTSSPLLPSKGARYSYQVKRLKDSWVESFVVLGEGVYDGKKVFKVSIDGKNDLMLYDLKTGNWIKTIRNGKIDAMATPYEDILKYPLTTGDSYSTEFYGNDSTASGNVHALVEVKMKDKIEVPAGTFDVYLLKAQLRYYVAGQSSMSNTARIRTKSIWFSPELRIAVKIEDVEPNNSVTTRYELLKYSAQ